MATQYRLTTFDNPYDPFEQFVPWFMFDVEKGYNTCSRLATFVNSSDDSTEQEDDEEVQRAIDSIIQYDVLGVYRRVRREASTES